MNNYKNQKTGISLFNTLLKDVSVMWHITVSDLFIGLILAWIVGGLSFEFMSLITIVLFYVVIPVVRAKYGLEMIYQRVIPSAFLKMFRIQAGRNGEILRD